LRLIRGAPGSGKTALVFRDFKAALAERRRDIRIVVPTATLVRHFQHELARDGVVVSPRTVVSMNRFVRECAAGPVSAPDAVLRLVVRDALRRLNPPEFSGIATTGGMTDVVVESIRLLENAGGAAAKLAIVRGLGPHAKALGRIWLDVDARLRERGFVGRPELFEAAANGAPPLTLWLDGFVTLSRAERSFLERIASRCEIAITAPDDPRDEIRRWALQRGARDQLLSGSARHPSTVAVAAATPEREADEIARRIAGLRRNGTAYRDVGIAVRDPETYRPLLESAFERFGIPARFYFSRPLGPHPAARFLSGAIRSALDGWNFEDTLAALRAHPGWSATAAFDRFDFAVREAMPGRGWRALADLAEDDRLRERLETCFGIDAWISQERTPREWSSQMESWARAIYRPGHVEEPGELRDLVRLRAEAQGLRAWIDAIGSALAFWTADAGRISLADFWNVASAAIEDASVTTPDDRADAIHVMNVLEARQWNLASLFVCGFTDLDYPRKHARHLLFSASDTDKLAREGIRIRTADDQDADERRLIQSLATRATGTLVFTFPEHDSAGRGIIPSRFLPSQRVSARLCAPAAAGSARRVSNAGRIVSPALLSQMAARHQTVSTTHIESLAQCRFQFFSKKTLQLEPRPERPYERIGPREAGLILHETLELWLKDRTRDFAALFEDTFENACAERHLPRGYRLEVERFTLRNVARAVSASDSWPVEFSEAEIDVMLPLIDGVTMTGRVDRIDHVGGSDCVVIDYKAKGKAGMKRLVESETTLQGPLYARALRRQFGLNTVAMVYWAVRENELHGWGNIPSDTGDHELLPLPPDWEEAAWSRIADRLTGFFGGDVSPAPTHDDACRFCDARDCCRVEETRGLVMIEAARG
jgi:RecB family exonuclease